MLVGALPQILATRRAVQLGWVPVADNTKIAADAVSAAHGHPALLGAESSTLQNFTDIRPIHHLGPSESLMLGVAHWLMEGPGALLVAILAISLLATWCAVRAADRLAGPGGMVTAAVCLASFELSLGTAVLGDIWNPNVPLVPFFAALLAIWAWAATGWEAGLPLSLVLASYCVQAHVTYGPPLVGVVAAVLAIRLVVTRRWPGRSIRPSPRLAAVSSAGLLAMWSLPVWSELSGDHSNVSNVLRATMEGTGEPSLGAGFATRVLSAAILVPPPLGPPGNHGAFWFVPRGVGVGQLAVLGGVGALLSVVAVTAWRRRDRIMLTGAAGAACLLIVGWALLGRATFSSGAALYQTRWLWPLATFVWLVVVIGLGRALGPSVFGAVGPEERSFDGGPASHDRGLRDRTLARGHAGAPASASATRIGSTARHQAVLVVLTVSFVVTVARTVGPGDYRARTYPPDVQTLMWRSRLLATGIERHLPRATPVTFDLGATSFSPEVDTALNVAAALLVEGRQVRLRSPDPLLRNRFGPRYAAGSVRTGVVLRVQRYRTSDERSALTSTPGLSVEERHRAAWLRRRIVQETGTLEWTAYGAIQNFGDGLDPSELLVHDRLEQALYEHVVKGSVPRSLIQEHGRLARRFPEERWQVIVAQRPGASRS